MSYAVKEIFYTLQGEGLRAGRPAVFCRFAGCNLWSGREADRATAVCRFCDTDFVGTDGTLGGKFADAQALAALIAAQWPAGQGHRYVVLTGGEPLLQVDEALTQALHAEGFEIAVETNGSLLAPPGIDWICVSPKAGAPLVQRSGHELKLCTRSPASTRPSCRHWTSSIFCCNPWTTPSSVPTPAPASTTVRPSPAGACRCKPTKCWTSDERHPC